MTPRHIKLNTKAEAEAILEGVLNRTRWTVDVRDALAERIDEIVKRAFQDAGVTVINKSDK